MSLKKRILRANLMRNRPNSPSSRTQSLGTGVSRKNTRLCPRCATRYVQDVQTGLCRSCGRQTGAYRLTSREAEAARLERLYAAEDVDRLPEPEPRVNPVRIIDGVEYEVVFP